MSKKVEDCVKKLMSDPDFKPLKGRTKEESAWAVCQSQYKKSKDKDKECCICDIKDMVTFKEAVEQIREKLNSDLKPSKNDLELESYSEKHDIKINDKISKEDLDKINKFTVKPVNDEDVRIYEALLIDDQVTRNATQYPAEFQKMLLSLPHGEGNFIGATFLLGDTEDHQETASAQIGRIFDAWQVTDEKGNYGVMGKIYLLKDGNDETIKKIDTGVLKEVSIATKVEMPMCSLCNQDIRVCGHQKGENGCYITMTGKGFCGEVSLVAVPGSSQAKILNESTIQNYARIESIEELQEENTKLQKQLVSVNEKLDKLSKLFEEISLAPITLGKQLAPLAIGAVKAAPKAVSFLKKIMQSGVAKMFGRAFAKKISTPLGVAAGGILLSGLGTAVNIASKIANVGAKALSKSLKKSKKFKFLKGFKLSAEMTDVEKEELVNTEIKFDDMDEAILKEVNLLPEGVTSLEEMSEDQIATYELELQETISQLETMIKDIENVPSDKVIKLNENDGTYQVAEQEQPTVDEIKHNIKIASTLNDINVKIAKANEKIVKYGAKYIAPVSSIASDPIPKMDEGLKDEDANFVVSVFYRNVNTLANNLKSIEAILNMPEVTYPDYDGELTEIAKATSYIHGKIENILNRIYQLQGRFNLESKQKEELIKETLRLGVLANTIKIDKKEDVKTMLDNMSYEQIKKLSESFYDESTKIYGPNKDIKSKENSTKKENINPVSIMDYKDK